LEKTFGFTFILLPILELFIPPSLKIEEFLHDSETCKKRGIFPRFGNTNLVAFTRESWKHGMGVRGGGAKWAFAVPLEIGQRAKNF